MPSPRLPHLRQVKSSLLKTEVRHAAYSSELRMRRDCVVFRGNPSFNRAATIDGVAQALEQKRTGARLTKCFPHCSQTLFPPCLYDGCFSPAIRSRCSETRHAFEQRCFAFLWKNRTTNSSPHRRHDLAIKRPPVPALTPLLTGTAGLRD